MQGHGNGGSLSDIGSEGFLVAAMVGRPSWGSGSADDDTRYGRHKVPSPMTLWSLAYIAAGGLLSRTRSSGRIDRRKPF